MGIFSRIFRRKKPEPVPEPTAEIPPKEITAEMATAENVKARMDLVLAQMDSLRMQYEAMNERIVAIERMIKELYDMAKSQ